jgi:uncharacterized protein (DUF1778 family)
MAKKAAADPKRVQESGGARMAAAGRKPVQLGLKPDELAIIDEARMYEPRASFIHRVALEVAKKIIEERKK